MKLRCRIHDIAFFVEMLETVTLMAQEGT
jgi:hypothetical protein